MSTINPRPEGMPWVSPYLTVKDVDQAIDFYSRAFNFEKINAEPGEDGSTWHGSMRYKDQVLMFGKENVYNKEVQSPASSGVKSPVSMYLYCDDVDQLYQQAITQGATTSMEPQDAFWGDRMCGLIDPDGHAWCFATFSGERR